MSEKEKPLSTDMLMSEALLRLRTMENLLVRKGIFTKEEYAAEMMTVTRAITKDLLQRANVQGDLDALLDEIQSSTQH